MMRSDCKVSMPSDLDFDKLRLFLGECRSREARIYSVATGGFISIFHPASFATAADATILSAINESERVEWERTNGGKDGHWAFVNVGRGAKAVWIDHSKSVPRNNKTGD